MGIRARFDVLVSSLPQSKSLPLPAAVAVRSVGASGSGGGPLARPLTPSETADALTLRALLMLADDLRSSRLRDASAAQSATDTAAAGLPSLAVARAARKWLEAASSAAGEDGANPTEFDFAASNACALALCTSAECSAAAAKLDVDAVRRHLVEIRDLLMPVPFARQGHGSGLGVAAAAVAFARLVFGIHQKQQGRQETDIELARLERSAVTLLHHVATTVADPAACRLLGDLEHAVAKKLSTGVAKTQKTESGDSAGGLLSWWDRRRRQQEVETRLVLASEWFAIAEDMSRLG